MVGCFKTGREEDPAEPDRKGPAQGVLARGPEPLQEAGYHLEQLLRLPAVFQAEERRHQVVEGLEIRIAEVPLRQEQVAQVGTVMAQTAGDVLDQEVDVGGRCPGTLAIVEDHRQDRRQPVPAADLPGADQVLVEQADIGHDPYRHPVIDTGLEFQQEIDVEPVPAPAHPPDHVVLPAAQIVTDIAAIDFFQGGKVQVIDPLFPDKSLEEILHHPGMGEEKLVGVVMFGHGGVSVRRRSGYPAGYLKRRASST